MIIDRYDPDAVSISMADLEWGIQYGRRVSLPMPIIDIAQQWACLISENDKRFYSGAVVVGAGFTFMYGATKYIMPPQSMITNNHLSWELSSDIVVQKLQDIGAKYIHYHLGSMD